MKPERWQQVNDLFQSASERAPEERSAFLEEACHGDKDLCREVESLIASYERAENFIESPAFEVAPDLLLDDADALIGQHLGHYRIESVLGVGGMGVVYLARDERLGRKVALKLLPERLTADATRLSRFKTEARTASALNHPNIVTIHEIGEANGTHYIATEFIDGTTLRQRMAQGPIPPNEALPIALQIAGALSVAHAAGIVHRDIKPENIMLRPDGYVKVLDFGIAKFTQPESPVAVETQTQQGMILGTTRYMSPEQVRGLPIDARTDIWSLGVVLYEMVAAQQPFDGATPTDVIISIAEREPVPLAKCAREVPGQLQGVVQKALAKDREKRFQTANDLLTDLKSLARELEKGPGLGLRRSRIPILAGLIIGMLIVGWWVFSPFLRQSSRTASPTEIKSLAVLPLQNLSGDSAQEYFAEGMTDELIGELAQLTPLRVISRTSTMQYKGTKKSLPRIARELQVDAVIEGTVQRADGRVRIRAQLIEARSDRHLWAQTYERDLQDVLKLQSDISQAIAREVRTKITPADLARLTSRPAVRPKAFDAYLQGRYLYWNKRTVENLGKAIELFERAIREDPAYALPYVGVADCYNSMGSVHIGALPPPEARRRAEEAALKALELDPTLAEAHTALGVVRHYSWDWNAAEAEFKRAIELNPNYANAHNFYASYLMSRGRLDEVFAASNRARELDPLSLAISAQRGFLLFLARRYDESIEQLRGIIATDPNHYQAHWFLAHTYAANGKLDDAIVAAEKAAALSARSPGALGILGMVYGFAGKKDEATKVVSELLELGERRYVTPAALVFAYTGLGDKDQAFVWMEKSYQERSNFMAYLQWVPLLDSLRSDPRFEEMLRRVMPPNYSATPASSPNEKSIAVLPFEDLSGENEDAFFANGVHDEILTNLAKIADLKVISRTSVMGFRDTKRNLREIAQTLGVAHIVEGTVQRAADRVRVSAQLIDARTDTHLWAEHYDRELADVFAVQSEIAQQIADQLRSRLSPAERAAIAQRPTADLVAYALYTKAKELDIWGNWEGAEKSLARKVELLEKATQRDPSFALAYCALAKTQADLFVVTGAGFSSLSRPHLELAKKAADAALRVRPDLGEAHLALARYYFHADDFDRARGELTVARRRLPNNSEALFIAARIDRRQNRWDDSLASLRKASELDPRSTEVASILSRTYFDMRRYRELEALVTKDAASGTLQDPWTQLWLARIKLAKGDPVAAQALLAQVPLDFSPNEAIWDTRFTAALYSRDYDAANRVIAATPAKFAHRFLGAEGRVAVARGDKQKAQSIFLGARKKLDATWGDKPKDEQYFEQIAELDAGLGRKEEAIREARRALDLRPITKDSLQGPQIATTLALVYAWSGERDAALEQLEIVAKIPAGPTYGDLCFNPCWDALRNDKRFDKIIASLAPKK